MFKGLIQRGLLWVQEQLEEGAEETSPPLGPEHVWHMEEGDQTVWRCDACGLRILPLRAAPEPWCRKVNGSNQ